MAGCCLVSRMLALPAGLRTLCRRSRSRCASYYRLALVPAYFACAGGAGEDRPGGGVPARPGRRLQGAWRSAGERRDAPGPSSLFILDRLQARACASSRCRSRRWRSAVRSLQRPRGRRGQIHLVLGAPQHPWTFSGRRCSACCRERCSTMLPSTLAPAPVRLSWLAAPRAASCPDHTP